MAPHKDHSEEIERLVERAEKDPRTHTFARLADLYRKTGELERALSVVENGLRHHPHYLNARLVHARILRELDRPRDARTAFERVLQIDSENLVARAALAELGAGRPIDLPRGGDPAPSRGWLARLDAEWRSVTGDSGMNGGDGGSGPDGTEATEKDDGPTHGAEPRRPGTGDVPHAAELRQPRADVPDRSSVPVSAAASRAEKDDAAEVPLPAAEGDPSEADPDSSQPKGPPESASSRGSPAPEPPEVETATLAALYVRQGLLDRAIAIYERLLARDPYNARLASALEEARSLAHGGEPSPRPRESPVSSAPAPTGATSAAPEPVVGGGKAGKGRAAADGDPGSEADLSMREFLVGLLEGKADVGEGPARERWPEWIRELGAD